MRKACLFLAHSVRCDHPYTPLGGATCRWPQTCLLVMSVARIPGSSSDAPGSPHFTVPWMPLTLCRAVGAIEALA